MTISVESRTPITRTDGGRPLWELRPLRKKRLGCFARALLPSARLGLDQVFACGMDFTERKEHLDSLCPVRQLNLGKALKSICLDYSERAVQSVSPNPLTDAWIPHHAILPLHSRRANP